MTADENGTVRPGALGRGIGSLIDDVPAPGGDAPDPACGLAGMRAVLGMRVRGRG